MQTEVVLNTLMKRAPGRGNLQKHCVRRYVLLCTVIWVWENLKLRVL